MHIKLDNEYYEINKTKLIVKNIVTLVISILMLVFLQKVVGEVVVSILGACLLLLNTHNLSSILILLLHNKINMDNTLMYDEKTTLLRFPLLIIFGAVRLPIKHTTFLIIREYSITKRDKTHITCLMEFRIFIMTIPIRIAINKEDGKLFYNKYKELLKNHSVEVMYEAIR